MRKLGFLFVFLVLTIGARSAPITYDRAYLARLGIDLSNFKIATFSGNHQVAVGVEQVNSLELRAKGFVWALRVFHLFRDGRIESMRSILLPISQLDNLAVDNSGKLAIVAAQYGTEILSVNLSNGKIKTLFAHREGQPGFRTQSFLANRHGQFIAMGYFYDGEGYWLSNAVARLNLSHPDSSAFFTKTWDIGDTFKKLGTVRLTWISSPTEGFLAAENGKDISLYHYDNGKLTPLDTAKAFAGFAAAPHRVLYFALRQGDLRETLITDTASHKTWVLAKGEKAYLYPYLSEDGKVAVVALIDLPHAKISLFYARENENFTLHPIPDLQDVPLGVFRLSSDGALYAFQNKDGLTFGKIPSPTPPPILY